ncbi:MAG: hypothetical protein AABZ51_04350 [Nitrospirota bacterium]
MRQKDCSVELKQLLYKIDDLVDRYPRLIHTWRFAVSAVWALGHYSAAAAQRSGNSISEEEYIPDTKAAIKALVDDKPMSEDWERGFWFNAAIMRIDAFWERIFTLCLPAGVDVNGPSLYLLVQDRRAVPSNLAYSASSFGRVRKIVNQLKHEPGGAHPTIREDRDLPLQAMQDVLAVLDDMAIQRILQPMQQGPVLAGRRSRKNM